MLCFKPRTNGWGTFKCGGVQVLPESLSPYLLRDMVCTSHPMPWTLQAQGLGCPFTRGSSLNKADMLVALPCWTFDLPTAAPGSPLPPFLSPPHLPCNLAESGCIHSGFSQVCLPLAMLSFRLHFLFHHPSLSFFLSVSSFFQIPLWNKWMLVHVSPGIVTHGILFHPAFSSSPGSTSHDSLPVSFPTVSKFWLYFGVYFCLFRPVSWSIP